MESFPVSVADIAALHPKVAPIVRGWLRKNITRLPEEESPGILTLNIRCVPRFSQVMSGRATFCSITQEFADQEIVIPTSESPSTPTKESMP